MTASRDGASSGLDRVPIDVVAYGRPATEALNRRILAAKTRAGGHPLDPVTVIVPSNSAGLSARRLLATGVGDLAPLNLANVSFVTPYALAEQTGAGLLTDRQPLSDPVLGAAVRNTLREEPGSFAPVASHAATAAALRSTYAEVSRCTPAARAALAADEAGAEILRLVGAIAGRLDGFFDEDDLVVAAGERLGSDPALAQGLGAVVWHLPDRLSPAMAGLVGTALGASAHSSAVVALTGVAAADAAVHRSIDAVGLRLPADQPTPRTPVASALVSASDPDDEVREVVRRIVGLAKSSVRLDRIAVFRPSGASYPRTLVEQLDAAGVPHHGPSIRRLADSMAGRLLANCLLLPERGWGRADVVHVLDSGPVRVAGRTGVAHRFDDLSRSAGVVGGLDDWRAKLAGHRAQLVLAVDAGHPSAAEALALTDELAPFLEALAAHLATIEVATSWTARSAAARSVLSELLGAEQWRGHWPSHEVHAAERIDAVLGRLGALDDIESGAGADAFRSAVMGELEATSGRLGRFGHGVLLGPLSLAPGLDLDAVFVVGMAEGSCPAVGSDDPLVPDRLRLVTSGELPTRADRLADQHRAYLAAVASGAECTLLYPRADLRSRRQRLASRWLLDSATAQTGKRIFSSDVASLDPSALEAIPSFTAGLASADVAATAADRTVGALLVSPDWRQHPLMVGDLARGVEARTERNGPRFSEWDGNLAGVDLSSALTRPISATRLQKWAECPFRFYLSALLGLRERDDPELVTSLPPMDRGSLVHLVLEQFIEHAIDRPDGPPRPDQPWTVADHKFVEQLAAAAFLGVENRGIAGRPLHWRRTQAEVLADLHEFLRRDDRHRAESGATPASVEFAFGGTDEPVLELALPSGRVLKLVGRVDRVDHTAAGEIIVIDYKTGKGDRYEGLDDDPVLAGKSLQLPIYAEAARAGDPSVPVQALFWMISSAGGFKQHGYDWESARKARFLDVTEVITDGIAQGVFPAQPGEYDPFFTSHKNCGFCDFNRVCPRDRDDHARAIADTPEVRLVGRLALAVDEVATS